MPEKTYVNHRPGSVSWTHADEFGAVKHDTLPFVNGVLTTGSPEMQKYVESLSAFEEHWITLKNDARTDLLEKVSAAKDAATVAESAALQAETTRVELDALPKRLRATAEKAKTDAAAAVAALADFDKAAAPVTAAA